LTPVARDRGTALNVPWRPMRRSGRFLASAGVVRRTTASFREPLKFELKRARIEYVSLRQVTVRAMSQRRGLS
jgi:hypothetical protein